MGAAWVKGGRTGAHVSAAVAAAAVLRPPPAGLLRHGRRGAASPELSLLDSGVIAAATLAAAAVAAPQAHATVGRGAPTGVAATAVTTGRQRNFGTAPSCCSGEDARVSRFTRCRASCCNAGCLLRIGEASCATVHACTLLLLCPSYSRWQSQHDFRAAGCEWIETRWQQQTWCAMHGQHTESHGSHLRLKLALRLRLRLALRLRLRLMLRLRLRAWLSRRGTGENALCGCGGGCSLQDRGRQRD